MKSFLLLLFLQLALSNARYVQHQQLPAGKFCLFTLSDWIFQERISQFAPSAELLGSGQLSKYAIGLPNGGYSQNGQYQEGSNLRYQNVWGAVFLVDEYEYEAVLRQSQYEHQISYASNEDVITYDYGNLNCITMDLGIQPGNYPPRQNLHPKIPYVGQDEAYYNQLAKLGVPPSYINGLRNVSQKPQYQPHIPKDYQPMNNDAYPSTNNGRFPGVQYQQNFHPRYPDQRSSWPGDRLPIQNTQVPFGQYPPRNGSPSGADNYYLGQKETEIPAHFNQPGGSKYPEYSNGYPTNPQGEDYVVITPIKPENVPITDSSPGSSPSTHEGGFHPDQTVPTGLTSDEFVPETVEQSPLQYDQEYVVITPFTVQPDQNGGSNTPGQHPTEQSSEETPTVAEEECPENLGYQPNPIDQFNSNIPSHTSPSGNIEPTYMQPDYVTPRDSQPRNQAFIPTPRSQPRYGPGSSTVPTRFTPQGQYPIQPSYVGSNHYPSSNFPPRYNNFGPSPGRTPTVVINPEETLPSTGYNSPQSFAPDTFGRYGPVTQQQPMHNNFGWNPSTVQTSPHFLPSPTNYGHPPGYGSNFAPNSQPMFALDQPEYRIPSSNNFHPLAPTGPQYDYQIPQSSQSSPMFPKNGFPIHDSHHQPQAPPYSPMFSLDDNYPVGSSPGQISPSTNIQPTVQNPESQYSPSPECSVAAMFTLDGYESSPNPPFTGNYPLPDEQMFSLDSQNEPIPQNENLHNSPDSPTNSENVTPHATGLLSKPDETDVTKPESVEVSKVLTSPEDQSHSSTEPEFIEEDTGTLNLPENESTILHGAPVSSEVSPNFVGTNQISKEYSQVLQKTVNIQETECIEENSTTNYSLDTPADQHTESVPISEGTTSPVQNTDGNHSMHEPSNYHSDTLIAPDYIPDCPMLGFTLAHQYPEGIQNKYFLPVDKYGPDEFIAGFTFGLHCQLY